MKFYPVLYTFLFEFLSFPAVCQGDQEQGVL